MPRTVPIRLLSPMIFGQRVRALTVVCGFAAMLCVATVGCHEPDPIVTYTIPKNLPEQLRPSRERMLGVMVPKGDQVWFFKVTGPETAIAEIEPKFRDFVKHLKFSDGVPDLTELPASWRRGGEKPMRYATIDIDTSGPQLSVSVSKLARQQDWDNQVAMNVNRWRGQLGLAPSTDKWAEAEPVEVASADQTSVWVDIVGAPPDVAPTTPHPGSMQGPTGATADATNRSDPPARTDASSAEPAEQPVTYQPPEGWREGQRRSMRLAAFEFGPEDAPAELTIIPAGGGLRDNVARWIGQVRPGEVPDDVVDQILDEAQSVDIDGRQGQRFLIPGDETMIDATIIPIGNGFSLFVKATGPTATVTEQSEAIAEFLKSLKLNL